MPPHLLLILRFIILLPLAYLLYRSQRYWFAQLWRLTARIGPLRFRWSLRVVSVLVLGVLILPGSVWFATGSPRPVPDSLALAVSGLWLSSALGAWVGVQAVGGAEWLWTRWRRDRVSATGVRNASRRHFFQTVSYAAGAVPFVGACYGFLVERLHYRLEAVEIPIPGLPAALDGLRIVQLSDIHIGGYMPRHHVRRAVEMANETGAELAVVTGDLVSGRHDPIGACVEELARLRAPLGVWGCNGNHEIYARLEDRAAHLFRQAGMRMLRRESAALRWRGQPLNLIGVDYQVSRGLDGRSLPLLRGVAPLVRHDAPNILLSHNPNAFVRAAELGIQLTLAGHTHGGQIQVEILHERLNPARFFTEFIAGLYRRPLVAHAAPPAAAFLYVNRGLGTIGTPVRLNSPPEITLLTLRRA